MIQKIKVYLLFFCLLSPTVSFAAKTRGGSSGGGGTTSPAGSSGDIQYYNAGAFGADSSITRTGSGALRLGTSLNVGAYIPAFSPGVDGVTVTKDGTNDDIDFYGGYYFSGTGYLSNFARIRATEVGVNSGSGAPYGDLQLWSSIESGPTILKMLTLRASRTLFSVGNDKLILGNGSTYNGQDANFIVEFDGTSSDGSIKWDTVNNRFDVTAGDVRVNSTSICLEDGTNCPPAGSGGASSLEVFSNYFGTRSTPTASMSITGGLSLTVTGSTAVVNAVSNSTSIANGLGTAINVKAYGAVGDGVTNDRTAILNALAAGSHIYFPPGNYFVSDSIILNTSYSGYIIEGAGASETSGIGTRLTSNTTNQLFLSSGTTSLNYFTIKNMSLYQNASTNGDLIQIEDSANFITISNIVFNLSNSAAKFIDATSPVFSFLNVENIRGYMATGATVPAISVITTPYQSFSSLFSDIMINSNDTATAPIIYMEQQSSTVGGYHKFERVICEVPDGGCIETRSLGNLVFENVNTADTVSASAPGIYIASSTASGALPSTDITFIGCVLTGGTTTHPDLKIQDTNGQDSIALINSRVSILASTSAPVVQIGGSYGTNLVGDTRLTKINHEGSGGMVLVPRDPIPFIQLKSTATALATCLGVDSDRLYGDLDCNASKGGSEQYLDETSGTPGGSPNQIQYNNGGAFDGISTFSYYPSTNALNVGATAFFSSSIYVGTTTSVLSGGNGPIQIVTANSNGDSVIVKNTDSSKTASYGAVNESNVRLYVGAGGSARTDGSANIGVVLTRKQGTVNPEGLALGHSNTTAPIMFYQNASTVAVVNTSSMSFMSGGRTYTNDWSSAEGVSVSTRVTAPILAISALTSKNILGTDANGDIIEGTFPTSVGVRFYNGGSALSAGATAYVQVPTTFTVTSWSIYSQNSCSASVVVMNDTEANFPPTLSDAISGTEKPSLSAQTLNTDTNLTTWTTTEILKKSFLAFYLESVSACTDFSAQLFGTGR